MDAPNEQLRRRSVGAPAARSLLLTVLGEYVLLRPEGVWQETLVAAMTTLGYTRQAARQALSRSSRDGWLATERRGRRSRMTLSPRTAELLRSGAERIYSFGEPRRWDGRWLIVVLRVPEKSRAVRHQLRSRLAWTGLGSLGAGVWLTPHVEREAELAAAIAEAPAAEARSFVAEIGEIGSSEELIADAWELERVRRLYLAFIADFRSVRALSSQACFRQQTLLVHAWRKFPFLDPDLPGELLPDGWPRQQAHQLFVERHEQWRTSALAYFAQLEGEPELAGRRAA